MTVAIIDYGMGNLGSVVRAFEECGGDVLLATHPAEIAKVDHLVLPGVGSFSKGFENLKSRGWVDIIRQKVLEEKTPILGICLGMQMLADRGFEGGESEGLGLISGSIQKFQSNDRRLRIPHVGWNEISFSNSAHPLLKSIPSGTDFYFVHSYVFHCKSDECSLASTDYCGGFNSIVAHNNVMGVQFHPEKSGKPGFKLIRNFLAI